MISPCTLVCSIDMNTGFCLGCGRTGNEIAAWTSFTDAERRSVMDTLASRLQGIEPKSRREAERKRMEKPLIARERRRS